MQLSCGLRKSPYKLLTNRKLFCYFSCELLTKLCFRKQLLEHVIKPVIPADLLDDKTVYHLNPCGSFVIGGPMVSFLFFLDFISFIFRKYFAPLSTTQFCLVSE